MTTAAGATDSIEQTAKRGAARAARSRSVERAGRVGFLARGLLIVISALITLQIALGGSEDSVGAQGAIAALARQPFGTVLLGLLAAGLAGYALLRLVQTWTNPSGEDGLKGLAYRAGYLVRAVAYGGLAALTVRQLIGGGGGEGGQEQALTARLLSWPGGPWLVGAVGVVIAGIGVFQIVRGVTRGFTDDLRWVLSGRQRRWAVATGVAGYVGRGAMLLIAAWFVISAAATDDARRAGLDAALQRFTGEPYGAIALGAAAVGLFLFGLWCWVLARYGAVKEAD